MLATIPITILFIGLFAAELTLIPHWALWVGGISLLVGRLMHAAILVIKGWGLPRAIGMIMTFIPMAGFGGWAVFISLS